MAAPLELHPPGQEEPVDVLCEDDQWHPAWVWGWQYVRRSMRWRAWVRGPEGGDWGAIVEVRVRPRERRPGERPPSPVRSAPGPPRRRDPNAPCVQTADRNGFPACATHHHPWPCNGAHRGTL